MEQWRERGFVPDSDDEEEYESQEIIHREAPAATQVAVSHEDGRIFSDINKGKEDDGDEEDRPESQVLPDAQLDPDLNEHKDLDDDPLQDDELGLRPQPPKIASSSSTVRDVSRTPHATPSPQQLPIDPPSSPDELQFEEHSGAPAGSAPLVQSSGAQQATVDEAQQGSTQSSPLSSPPDSPSSLPSQQQIHDILTGLLNRPEELPEELQHDSVKEAISKSLERPGRSLRQRNPIQLHPYLLENANYRNLLRARGVQPVRLARTDEHRRAADESQEKEYEDENGPPSSDPAASFQFPPSSPPPAPPTTSRLGRVPQPLRDLPQSNNVGRGAGDLNGRKGPLRSVGTTTDGRKRRKISHTSGRRSQTQNNDRHTQIRAIDHSTDLREQSHASGIFDIPPSPPRSGGPLSTPTTLGAPKFRFPRGGTPPNVVTPPTDSRQSARGFDAVNIDSSSGPDRQPEQGSLHPSVERETESEEESGEDSEDSTDREMRFFQRKIRGVLPASWARLDFKKQQHTISERDRIQSSRDRLLDGKGVAQKIVGGNRRRRDISATMGNALSLSEDSDSDGNPPPVPEPHSPGDEDLRDTAAGYLPVDDDIPEDNDIDYLFPSVPRPRKQKNTIRDSFERDVARTKPRRPRLPVKPKPCLKRQTRLTDTIRIKGPSKWRPPRLGILDAPDVAKQQAKKQPQFLRIAARQARSRRDQGRKSPTRKYLRLGSRADTEDVNASLRDWKAGKLQQSRITDANSSKPRQTPRPRRPDNGFDRRDGGVASLAGSLAGSGRDTPSRTATHENNVPDRSETTPEIPNERHDLTATTSKRPKRANQPSITKRGYVISSMRRNNVRPAQLESTAPVGRRSAPSQAFHRKLSTLNSMYGTSRSGNQELSLPLARFLAQNGKPVPQDNELPGAVVRRSGSPEASLNESQRQRRRQLKKRQPVRVDVEAIDLRQPFDFNYEAIDVDSDSPIGETRESALVGLAPFGRPYTIDFDISHLQRSTFYHQSTFIGSGEFSRSLNLLGRYMDQDCGQYIFHHGGRSYCWGPWNDTALSEISTLLSNVVNILDGLTSDSEEAQSDVPAKSIDIINIYRAATNYINDKLWFMDPIDRSLFIDRSLALVCKVNDSLPPATINETKHTAVVGLQLRVHTFNLVLANQLRQVASHELVDESKTTQATNLMASIADRVLRMVFSDPGMSAIRLFREENNLQLVRDTGIKTNHPYADAFVIARYVIQTAKEVWKRDDSQISDVFLTSMGPLSLRNVQDLENTWNNLFTILPLYEIDELGLFFHGRRSKQPTDLWPVVEHLISPVLDAYLLNSRSQPASFNAYCRTLFHRCFYLLDAQGWPPNKRILEVLFDFFAKNTLHNLHNEQTHGSPRFLDELELGPRLEVHSRDSCFHILLKIIAISLRSLSASHDKKVVRKFVWRLLPNHGRVYPKEEELREEDLNALRNHHDILCTLYWASPDGCRPRLQTLRNLVDPAKSHLETCSIHIQAWQRLVKFQLTTDDDVSCLVPFNEWHTHFTVELLKQHSLARTEVEAQIRSNLSSHKLAEAANTITKNQRRVESLLSSAVCGTKIALDLTKSAEQAKMIMEAFPFEKLLGLFNPRVPRLVQILCQTLDVVLSYLRALERASGSTVKVDASEDSQDFGDWTELADMYDDELKPPSQGMDVVETKIRLALSQFVSDCFGEDDTPDDAILLKAIDCWVSVAYVLVKNDLRQWDSYLSRYNADSWVSLRSTDQTRKFTAHFLAVLIEKDSSAYQVCKPEILDHWIACLAERVSMLKFQHQLTNALLNQDGENPLFRNLPFVKNRCGQYSMTLDEFSRGRLSLISCILSNMREHLSEVGDNSSPSTQGLALQYRGLIKTLMGALRSNYEEACGGSEGVKGSYVIFVQQIVGFLQQHSQAICPLDQFFTDPATFPLPADDPTYVVARLKSYAAKLSVQKVAKQFVMFVQSVSERAAVDGQQSYLVGQLYDAMAGASEYGNSSETTIRAFFLHCIIPAYVEVSFRIPGAWILVRPFLQSLTRLFSELLLDVDVNSEKSIIRAVDSIGVYFIAVACNFRLLIDQPGLLEEPHILLTVLSFLETIISCLPVIDYLYRMMSDHTSVLVTHVDFFRQFVVFVTSSLFRPEAASFLDQVVDELDDFRPSTPPPFPQDIRRFAVQELENWLQNGCSLDEGKYYVRRGHTVREIEVDPACSSISVARTAFVETVEIFFGLVESLDSFCSY